MMSGSWLLVSLRLIGEVPFVSPPTTIVAFEGRVSMVRVVCACCLSPPGEGVGTSLVEATVADDGTAGGLSVFVVDPAARATGSDSETGPGERKEKMTAAAA